MIYIFIFLIGLCIGSFLNVCIYRIPRNISIITPPSFCPSCKKKIPFYLNIPLIAWIILKGKCKYCGTKISFRYFWVELFTGIIFLILFLQKEHFSFSFPYFLINFFIFCILFISAVIDIEFGIIPDKITIPSIILVPCFGVIFPSYFNSPVLLFKNKILMAIFNIFIGIGGVYIFFLFLQKLGGLITNKEIIGGGDIKLFILLGGFIGLGGTFFIIGMSSLLALPFSIVIYYFRKEEKLPFAPFIAVGTLIYLFLRPIIKI